LGAETVFDKSSNIPSFAADTWARMLSVHPQEEIASRIRLLREVVELLMWELSAISDRKWEELPELKKKKEAIAERLKQFDWTPGPEELEPLDIVMLKSQISDLEYQSRRKVQAQMQMIRAQLESLQSQKQYWLDCLNIYFRQYQPEKAPLK
jgi:hypothetical protein